MSDLQAPLHLPVASGALLLQCRPDFEKDCAAEIQARAAGLGVAGYCRAAEGWVQFIGYTPDAAGTLLAGLDFRSLTFTRQWFGGLAELEALPQDDRAGAIATAVEDARIQVSECFVERPETETGKRLASFCRKFWTPLAQHLERAGIKRRDASAPWRLHVFFLSATHAHVGLAPIANAAAWPMGIPRLRLPRAAPSRSALKLDEAMQVLLDANARAARLRPGMRAVDLGAAPGGWTWYLQRAGLRVTAVDNADLDPSLAGAEGVAHRRANGFRYRPDRPVDWLVCDMVEQPQRVVPLIGDWLAERECREAIFNMKLPMRRRYRTVTEQLEALSERLSNAGLDVSIACKQLYHDRHEVTVHAATTG